MLLILFDLKNKIIILQIDLNKNVSGNYLKKKFSLKYENKIKYEIFISRLKKKKNELRKIKMKKKRNLSKLKIFDFNFLLGETIGRSIQKIYK